jgi:hypothetical protein
MATLHCYIYHITARCYDMTYYDIGGNDIQQQEAREAIQRFTLYKALPCIDAGAGAPTLYRCWSSRLSK